MRLQLKQIALAGLVACLSASALATNYFFVAPKSGEMPKVAPFNVTLGAYTLPGAVVGVAYNTSGYNFASQLTVTGDPSYNASLATFALTSGNMPAGMALSAGGQLSGTPTTASASTTLQVAATYKSTTGSQSYNWVAAAPGYLASCAKILEANPSTASGVQTIDPDGSGALPPVSVNCDMTTNGGGWTMVVGINGATTSHLANSAVAWTGTQGSGTEFGKLSDAVINLLKGSTGSTTIAYRLTSGATTSFFPGSCVFSANGTVSGDCTKFTVTYSTTPSWTSGGSTNDGCSRLTYYGGLSSYIHAACNGNAVGVGSGNLIYSRPAGNAVTNGMVRGPVYATDMAGALWVR